MADTAYRDALDWLYGLVNYEAAAQPRDPSRFDLRRVTMLLDRLGNPHLTARTVHIAGSKGKGSTAAMIAAVLSRAGYRTGLYTSPHLVETTERFKVDGTDMTPAEFVDGIALLRPLVTDINAEARYGKLTTFEVMTVLAFVFFTRLRAEWQVIETGLGGRLDATNVVSPEVTVLTTIGLEHTEVLGHTLAEIAAEKAGIIKPGVPVVSAPQNPSAMAVIERIAAQKKAALHVPDMAGLSGSVFDNGRQAFTFTGSQGDYRLSLPLLGSYQRLNSVLAVTALEVLKERGLRLDRNDIEAGLAGVVWPGRFQVLSRSPWIILDGAHTPEAAFELRASLESFFPTMPRPAVLVVGSSLDKDIGGMAVVMVPLFDTVIAVRARHPRAMEPERLVEVFGRHGADVRTAPSVDAALADGRRIVGDGGLVVVSGSLFAVGEALRSFGGSG